VGQLVRPPRIVLECVRVDGFVFATVHAEVGLYVSGEVDAFHCYGTCDGCLEDPGFDRSTVVFDSLNAADVYGLEHTALIPWALIG
jgi:hypothetical protein